MNTNPIIRSELVRAVRSPRHYAMRAMIGLLLLYVAWRFDNAFGARTPGMPAGWEKARILRNLSWVADILVLELLWTQSIAIVLLVPGLVAGSIAEEDRRRSMLALLASPMSSGSIVLGKLMARLALVGVAMAIGLPVVLPLAMLGALDPWIVGGAYAMLMALTLFVGSLSMLVASAIRRPRAAMLWAYLAVVGWILLPAWAEMFVWGVVGEFAWVRGALDAILHVHPLQAAMDLWRVAMYGLFHPDIFAWAWARYSLTWSRVIGFEVVASALLLLIAAMLLRPRRLEATGLRRQPAAPERPPIGDDPMLWKERYAHGRPLRRVARVGIALLVVATTSPLIEPAIESFREWRSSWWNDQVGDWQRGRMNVTLRQLDAGLYVLALAAVAATAATSVTGERERGTWSALEMSPLDGREITRAKVDGALRSVRWLAIPFGIAWTIGLATGSLYPLGILATAVALVVFLRYGAAIGVLASMVAPTSGGAIAATAALLLVSNLGALLFVPMDLIGPLASEWTALYLAGVSPFVAWIAGISPVEIRWFLAGQPWEEQLSLPGGLWGARILLAPGLIRLYLLSLILHAIAATAAMRASTWAFHARCRGSPRRPDGPPPGTTASDSRDG